ncbi:zinc finger MYM-type protein 1-like [Metopolophium dirhodum]|uniref:zinc finger MYM-type protein 1-like n=1 Tax=Metopolophium dirhodum TaxID=44670 RepID=UPI0029903EFE|nr:zinc finger MYM-type protein 1-like [Metopolophium dirhodum]
MFADELIDEVWTNKGFSNWQKLNEKLKKHTKTKRHLVCLSKMNGYLACKKSGSVMVKQCSGYKEQVAKNRAYIGTLIDIILFLGKQGIAYRGHREDADSLNQGNFKELCGLLSNYQPDFKNKFDEATNYTSWSIQDQLIKLCAEDIRETIVKEIDKIGFFALMCDEARCYREEQLSICVRYTIDLDVYERFLCFVDVSKGQTSNNIVTALFECFEKQKLTMSKIKIIAQSYDGASVMSGHLRSVQSRIKEHYPYAVYTHCMAHRLNLVVVDTCKTIKSAKHVFNVLEAIYVHFSQPSKNKKLCEMQSNLGLNKGNLLRICDTRWVCRYKNCVAMLKNYSSILNILNDEIEEQIDKDVARALGILSSINKLEFIIVLHILNEVLSIINVLSNQLQSKSATLGKSSSVIQSVISTFENQRNEDGFFKLWEQIKEFAQLNQITLELSNSRAKSKRKRQEPRHLQSYNLETLTGTQSETECRTVEEHWKIIYFQIIDAVIVNLKYRFSDESLVLANSLDQFMKMDFEKGSYFINHYKDVVDIDLTSLKAEMLLTKNCLHNRNLDFDILGIKKVVTEDVFPNLFKLIQVGLAIPISSATCERSFSSMRRIKNWLRTSMEQSKFTDLSVINIERDLSNKIDKDKIINNFAMSQRRISLV